MGMVAPRQRIASAFVVLHGEHGDVTRHALQEGISRQVVYQRAERTLRTLDGQPGREENARLRQRVGELEEKTARLQQQLAQAIVVFDADKQARFATVGQALGVSLPVCHELMQVIAPGKVLSVPTLGRRTKEAGIRAGQVLEVLDAMARPQARQVAADEIYVKEPVLMMVEPESLCWLSGQLGPEASGEAWAEQFRTLPNLEQVLRDGGTGLAKGVSLINQEREQQNQPRVVDQGDHFHALRRGGVVLRHAERRAAKTLADAEEAQRKLEDCRRRGRDARGASCRAVLAWRCAEQAMDAWTRQERLWEQVKESLRLVTPDGQCNTRDKAEAALHAALAQLPDQDFVKTKRALRQPEMLSYLDYVQTRLAALEGPAELKAAAVRHECLRRQPELLEGERGRAAALRGVMIASAVVFSASGAVGQQVLKSVGEIFRTAYRASSLVECLNSALRMQQARHRKMTQGLLDLKRLHWNCHTFRTGRRRHTSPYQRLGLRFPKGVPWWDVLEWSPEQLRDQLSAAKTAG